MKEIKYESCISSRISHVNMKKIEEDYYHNVFQKSAGVIGLEVFDDTKKF